MTVRSGARFDKLAFPVGLAADANGSTVLVTESGSGELSRVDLGSGEITRLASGLQAPRGILLESGGETALVAESGSGEVSRVSLSSGEVVTVAQGLAAPHGLAFLPGEEEVLVTEAGAGQVTRLRLATGATSPLTRALKLPTGIVPGPEPGTALVAATGDSRIVKIDLLSGRSSTVATSLDQPVALALEEGGATVLAADAGIGALVRVRVADGERIEELGDGALSFPAGVIIQRDGEAALVTEADAGEISRLDLRSKATSVVVEGLGKPVALAPDAEGASALVLEATGDISRVDLQDGSLRTVASGLVNPRGFLLQEEGRVAIVSEAGPSGALGTDSGDLVKVRMGESGKQILATGLAGPAGAAFVGSELVVLEKLAGRASFVSLVTGTAVAFATALEEPIALLPADDGASALVLESSIGGALLRVSLPSGNQEVLARGFLGGRSLSPGRDPGEVFVADELVGSILRVDLASGVSVPLAEDLESVSAIALEPDAKNILAAGDFGLVRVDVDTGEIDTLIERRSAPFP